jgi:hypothetical protein
MHDYGASLKSKSCLGYPLYSRGGVSPACSANLAISPRSPKAGSARAFTNPNRTPNFVSFHAPHPGKGLGKAMMRKNLRHLLLNEDEFLYFLEDC